MKTKQRRFKKSGILLLSVLLTAMVVLPQTIFASETDVLSPEADTFVAEAAAGMTEDSSPAAQNDSEVEAGMTEAAPFVIAGAAFLPQISDLAGKTDSVGSEATVGVGEAHVDPQSTDDGDASALAAGDVSALATPDVWDGTIATGFAGGDGQSGTPYSIATGAQLAYLAQQTNAGTDYTGVYFILTNEIDLNRQSWTSIGTNSNHFKGNFDGTGKTISNLYINTANQYQGLFGYADGSELKNIALENVDITGSGNVGGVAGSVANYSSLTKCYATGTVTGTSANVGGVAGSVSNSSLTECYATGAASGSISTGGVAGSVSNNSSLTGCYATGAVKSTYTGGPANAGGVAGSVSNSSLTECYATGDVTSTNYAGGVAGNVSNNSSLTKCYATGDVTSTGDNTGGVVGTAGGYGVNSISLTGCYATGDVTSTGGNTGGVVGIAGGPNSNNYSFTGCYATGAVSGNTNVGGVAGSVYGANNYSLTGCYALNPSVGGSSNVGRILGQIGGSLTLNDNIAFDWMLDGTDAQFDSNPADDSGADKNGLGTPAKDFYTAAGFSSAFTADPWTYVPGKLPGLLGKAVDMPYHLTVPSVSGIAPSGSGASISGNIVITFSADVQDVGSTVTLSDGTATNTLSGATLSPDKKTLSVPYSGLAYNTAYTVTVPEGRWDAKWENLSLPGSGSFTTSADKSALNAVLNTAGGIHDGGVYTTAAWTDFANAAVAGAIVFNTAAATQAEVDTATATLNAAILALKYSDNGNWFENGVSSHTIGSTDSLVHIAAHDWALHTGVVKVDGNTLTSGTQYTSAEGSTRTTLLASYLNTLTPGAHTLTVEYADGTANISNMFEILAASVNNSNSGIGEGGSPKTSDDSTMTVWWPLLVCAALGMLCLILWRKRQREAVGK